MFCVGLFIYSVYLLQLGCKEGKGVGGVDKDMMQPENINGGIVDLII